MSADAPDLRDRFSEALEGELSAADKEAFDAALAADASLRDDFEAFRALFRGAAAIASDTDAETDEKPPALLAGVQKRLHKRSRGRFYRDRFSRDASGRGVPILLAILVLLILAVALLALQNMVVIETGAASPHHADAPPPGDGEGS